MSLQRLLLGMGMVKVPTCSRSQRHMNACAPFPFTVSSGNSNPSPPDCKVLGNEQQRVSGNFPPGAVLQPSSFISSQLGIRPFYCPRMIHGVPLPENPPTFTEEGRYGLCPFQCLPFSISPSLSSDLGAAHTPSSAGV